MGFTVYTDILSGDQLISSKYNLIDRDDVVYEVDCVVNKKIRTGGPPPDPSEDGEEWSDDLDVIMSLNVVDDFQLVEIEGGSYRSFQDYIKNHIRPWVKEVIAVKKRTGASDEGVKSFQTGVTKYLDHVIKPNFKNYNLYTGFLQNPQAMLLLLDYREDGITPYFTIWKHALKGKEVEG